jgi:PAS domain-containing protein
LLAGPGTGEPVIRVHPLEDNVSGYTRMTDLNGLSILLEVDIPREVFDQGMGTLVLTLCFFVIFSVTTLLIMIFILDSLVLRRLLSLRDQVNSLGSTTGIPPPVLSGSDELTDLEHAILSKHHDLSSSEDRLRAFIDAFTDQALLLSSDGTIILANEAVAGGGELSVKDIIGKKLADLPSEVRILDEMHLHAVVESKKVSSSMKN